MTKWVLSIMNLHHALYIFMHLFVQVSWVASKQPDDPPKCRTDERTWVCVLCSPVFPCFTRSSSLFLFKWCHWSFYDNKDSLFHLLMECIILLMPFYFLQNWDDGAGHPVLGPICHAGGDGCIYSFEEGRLQTGLPDESSLTRTLSEKILCNFLPAQWMFLQLNPSWDGPIKQLLADADAWLCKRRTGAVRPHGGKQLSWQVLLKFVWSVRMPWFVLQTCARRNPSWAQRRAFPFVQCSNMFVSSTSSTIWLQHASWREIIFCHLVRVDVMKWWICFSFALEEITEMTLVCDFKWRIPGLVNPDMWNFSLFL